MPNNKKHKVSKIKGAEKAHPFSRKAAQMRRAFAREERVASLKSHKDADRMRVVDRMVWFKYALQDDIPAATPEIVHDLIDQYINRNEQELEDLKATIRPNRPRPAKIALLEMLQGKDRHEYRTGMKLPDMADAANVVRLRTWEGDYNGISAIKMVEVVESSKPKTMDVTRPEEMDAKDADGDGGMDG
ncbi:translation machinery-associated protein 16 [Chytriomyces sp. MP71]|nr:translation machinery-associated protein 16 [Chytriomyces sp. MP71]